MDQQRFDDLTRALSRVPSRRAFLKALAGSALGLFAIRAAGDGAVEAAGKHERKPRCTSNADCGACGVCQNGKCKPNDAACPACAVCDGGTLTCRAKCRGGQLCCGETGVCGPVGVCCTGEADCGDCQDCLNGTCVASPLMEGRECGDCKRCRNGSCSESDPRLFCDGVCCAATAVCSDQGCCDVADLCGDDCMTSFPGHTCIDDKPCPDEKACFGVCCGDGQSCDRASGTCCPHCLNDACCPSTHSCVNPGPFSANFCCDARINTPCGGGGGTFAACCSNANEECCNGECVPTGDCCANGFTASSLCCQDGPACDDACCAAGEACCDDQCLATQSDRLNCGGCGVTCNPGQVCEDGACGCGAGGTACGAGCCAAGERCDPITATCVACPEGQPGCGSQCCPDAGYTCDGGACLCPDDRRCDTGCCPLGQWCCAGACVSESASCCAAGETACGDQCCTADEECAGDVCVPKDQCAEDESPCIAEGVVFCCSGDFSVCCHGECIPAETPCCDGGDVACGEVCCGEQGCCGDACCCPAGEEYCQASDGSHTCCGEGSSCCNDACLPGGIPCCYGESEICGQTCCTPDQGCCGDDCCCPIGQRQCPDGSCVAAGESCCPPGQLECGETCIDPKTDQNNCGFCGHVCDACSTCTGGYCIKKQCGGCEYCDLMTGLCVGGCLDCKVCDEDLGACRDRRWSPPVCEDCVNGQIQEGVACGAQCCRAGSTCCGETCCDAGETCCGGTCCGFGQKCCEIGGFCMADWQSCCCGGVECVICPPFSIPWYCGVAPDGESYCSSNPV